MFGIYSLLFFLYTLFSLVAKGPNPQPLNLFWKHMHMQ